MDAVEDVKNRLNIEDVMADYVELKRAGRNFKALSPFSNEKTPSLMISPEKQIWHDFSSGKGGNMFSFVMEMEGLDFKGALELLARKAGVDLSKYRSGHSADTTKRKHRLYDINEAAVKFYQVHFTRHAPAYEYILKTRGYTKQTALAFRIGYSPVSGTALVAYLKQKGFTEDEIKSAGLSTVRRGQTQDMFRGRIMIPLMDAQGKPIGFTARLLDKDDNAPKYINTPQTLLYDKSRHVFGLHLAKEQIRKSNFVVVVEGNLDVVASYQAGVANVVATAGTAMTQYHLKELARFTHDVRLAFDEDNAGVQATERAVTLASSLDIALNIITIPSGKDPDELIAQDPKLWQKTITQSEYALDWLIDIYKKSLDITTATGKKAFAAKLMPLVSQLKDTVEKDHYLRHIADLLGVDKSALNVSDAAPAAAPRRRVKTPVQVARSAADAVKTQQQYLALMMAETSLRGHLAYVVPEMLTTVESKELFGVLKESPNVTLRTMADITKNLAQSPRTPGLGEFAQILLLLYEELYQNLENIELQYEAARLQVRVVEQYVKAKKEAIAKELHHSDDARTGLLLEKARKLDQLLREATKGA